MKFHFATLGGAVVLVSQVSALKCWEGIGKNVTQSQTEASPNFGPKLGPTCTRYLIQCGSFSGTSAKPEDCFDSDKGSAYYRYSSYDIVERYAGWYILDKLDCMTDYCNTPIGVDSPTAAVPATSTRAPTSISVAAATSTVGPTLTDRTSTLTAKPTSSFKPDDRLSDAAPSVSGSMVGSFFLAAIALFV